MYVSSDILQRTGEKGTGKGEEKWEVCEGQGLPFPWYSARYQKMKICNSGDGCGDLRHCHFPCFHLHALCAPVLPCRAQMPPVDGQNKLTNWLYHDGKSFLMFVEM